MIITLMEVVENCSHYDGMTDVNYYSKEIENDLISDEMRDYLEKSVYIKRLKKIKHLDQLDKPSLKIDALLVKLLNNDK